MDHTVGGRSEASGPGRVGAGVAPRSSRAAHMTRRRAVSVLAALAGGALVGCTPLRLALRSYPARFERDPVVKDRVLRAFVDAVVPGCRPDDPDLARALVDPELPFARYAAFLAADLCRLAESRHGATFPELTRSQRVAVVREGLRGDATARRLYDGAIFLAQLSCFAGIYDDERGCPLIEFEGTYRVRPRSELTYRSPERFLARPVTRSGNVA